MNDLATSLLNCVTRLCLGCSKPFRARLNKHSDPRTSTWRSRKCDRCMRNAKLVRGKRRAQERVNCARYREREIAAGRMSKLGGRIGTVWADSECKALYLRLLRKDVDSHTAKLEMLKILNNRSKST